MIDVNQTVASLVLDHSETAEVFQRNRIDFCCRGNLTIEAAAREKTVSLDRLVEQLTVAMATRAGVATNDPRSLSTSALITHIVDKHHAYLRKALPFVQQLASKVGRVHGDHNPKLRELHIAVDALTDALMPHLDEEEQVLFPMLTSATPDKESAARHLASMQSEHLEVAALLERVRSQADDFSLPTWACNSYRALFAELLEVEHDIFAHVHLENHVLRPRFMTE